MNDLISFQESSARSHPRSTGEGFSKLVLDTDTTADERARLMELIQRYCAVYQTPRHDSRMSMIIEAAGKTDAIGERVPG